jgi:hypothetical protein
MSIEHRAESTEKAVSNEQSVSNSLRRVTKGFISKTTFLSFPGLTGESRKTLDARLRTSGMTYKDVVSDVSNDRISKSLLITCHLSLVTVV